MSDDRVFALRLLDWPAWQAAYRPSVRVGVDWDLLERSRVRTEQVWLHGPRPPAKIWAPWYQDGNWRNGSPVELRLGPEPIVVVAPAVRLSRRDYMLLDGCHRIRGLRPRVLVLDALVVEKGARVCFTDLFNGPLMKKFKDGSR